MSAARTALAADPLHQQRHAEAVRAGVARAMQRPEEQQRREEHGRQLGRAHGGHNLGPAGSPERQAIGRKASATKLAWCPVEYRRGYHQLRRKGALASDARQMVEDLIAADLRRFLATGQLQETRR